MHEALLILGIFLMFAGFVSIFAYVLLNSVQQNRAQGNAPTNTSVGGVIMIGPIPIVFGNSPKMAIVAEILAIVLIVIAMIIFFLLGRR